MIRPFVGASAKMALSPSDLAEVARWLGGDPWPRPPWPTERAGLVLTRRGARLHAPGSASPEGVLWHPGMIPLRRRHLETDPLLRAVQPWPGMEILDATLGLGHDALILAEAGASVEGLEAVPALLYYTLDGLWRHAPGLASRVAGRCGDHRALMAQMADDSKDVVYLDPMFPDHARRCNAQWSPLRVIAHGEMVGAEALAEATRIARAAVVMKLHPGAPLPDWGAPRRVTSQRVQFAVWSVGSMEETRT